MHSGSNFDQLTQRLSRHQDDFVGGLRKNTGQNFTPYINTCGYPARNGRWY